MDSTINKISRASVTVIFITFHNFPTFLFLPSPSFLTQSPLSPCWITLVSWVDAFFGFSEPFFSLLIIIALQTTYEIGVFFLGFLFFIFRALKRRIESLNPYHFCIVQGPDLKAWWPSQLYYFENFKIFPLAISVLTGDCFWFLPAPSGT